MTAASPPPGHPVPQMPAADVLAELTALLAGFVAVEAQAVDAEESFAVLGLDSLLSVGFMGVLNTRFGTSVPPDALYQYPTPKALADRLAAELGGAASDPAASDAAASDPAVPVSAPVPAGDHDGDVLDRLRGLLARILGCAPDDIEADVPFVLLGLDSILSAQFVEGVNRIWGLREPTALLYDQPDLASVAAYVAANSRAGGGDSAAGDVVSPVPAEASVSPSSAASAASGASGASGAQVDLEALLDAVRDDLLSVDEAAALLGTRPA
ncbi:phosphopantetheine-binding protein [Streptomyces sp. NPDC001406]|uniref:phosphopantetheine-binding protein n=1 Tax=Streptomyces sp. NPDC001406 TaxID=3364572 RepID=UPI0036A76432